MQTCQNPYLWKTWYLWTAIKQCALKVPVVVPQRLPPPHHQNSWMCQVTRQRRMEVAMALRLLISWPHNRGESTPARQVQGNHRVLTGGGLRGVRGRCNVRRTSPTIAGVKGGGSQKWKQLLDAGKGKETDSPLVFLERNTTLLTSWYKLSTIHVRLLPSRTAG